MRHLHPPDNHTKSHQTGRLSEAFKRQQEEQKKKSLLAQEVLKNKAKAPQLLQVLPSGKKRPVHRVLGDCLPHSFFFLTLDLRRSPGRGEGEDQDDSGQDDPVTV